MHILRMYLHILVQFKPILLLLQPKWDEIMIKRN